MGSEVHEKIIRVLSEKSLLGDLEQMTEQVNKTMLEVFHAAKLAIYQKRHVLTLTK